MGGGNKEVGALILTRCVHEPQ